MLKSSYRKIWSNILTARWRASAWSDKRNKEQSADDPPWIRFVKNMLNSTISMSWLWCCNCMYRTYGVSGSIQSNWGSVGEARYEYEGLFPGGWLITITANHSNYLVCDRANTQSVTVRKVVKLQPSSLQCPYVSSEFTISSRSEEERGIPFFITFNWCICSLSTLFLD